VLRARTLGLLHTHGLAAPARRRLPRGNAQAAFVMPAPSHTRGAAPRRARCSPPGQRPHSGRASYESVLQTAAHISVANLWLHALACMCSDVRQQRGVCTAVPAAPDASPNLHRCFVAPVEIWRALPCAAQAPRWAENRTSLTIVTSPLVLSARGRASGCVRRRRGAFVRARALLALVL
jgi:hypothetical protein